MVIFGLIKVKQMLVKIFGMPSGAVGEDLVKEIISVVASEFEKPSETIKVSFSPITHIGSVRILPLGLDAFQYEYRITRCVGLICQHFCNLRGIAFPGFENPELPNQK